MRTYNPVTIRQRAKRIRNFLFRHATNLMIPVAGRLGIQTRPKGFFPCVLEWSNSNHKGELEEFLQYEEPRDQDHQIPEHLLKSDLSDCFAKLSPGVTTRQFRLCLRNARVYDQRAVIVHQSDRIFSELTYEYATEPIHFSFWNKLKIPPVSEQVGSIGVAHAVSADNYAHWVMEVVPQLIQLKEDLKSGEIEKIYVRCEKSFQKEWLDILGIRLANIIPAVDGGHLLAQKMVVYSMPMRNCEFSKRQLEAFYNLVPTELRSLPKKRIFIGREGGNRSFSLSDADLKSVVKSCGYEYVLMEEHSVEEKLAYFASAEVVAGPHGGGFGGIVFSDSSSELREIHSPLIPNLCYWRISSSCGLKYDAVYANTESGNNALKGVQKRLQMSSKELRDFLID